MFSPTKDINQNDFTNGFEESLRWISPTSKYFAQSNKSKFIEDTI